MWFDCIACKGQGRQPLRHLPLTEDLSCKIRPSIGEVRIPAVESGTGKTAGKRIWLAAASVTLPSDRAFRTKG
jgi:hypothetical protein